MKKRIFAIMLAAITAAGCMSGCSTEKTTEKSNSEVMTISWLGIPWHAGGEAGGYVQKLIEEEFNVKIEPIILDANGYKQQKPLLLSSGEIPDIIYELDPADLQGDANQGFLAEVPYETIKEYAPTAFGLVNEHEPKAWLYALYDGKNYGVPNLDYGGSNSWACCWRTDWLKNVGIDKVPETLTEMHEALKRFTYNDPDGDGKNDTYGMSGRINTWYNSFQEIYGAFGVLPFNWMEVDGKIVYGGLQQGTKDALAMLAQWYKEGLISPDFITDGTEITSFRNSITGYYGHGTIDELNEGLTNSTITVLKQLDPNAELVYSQIYGDSELGVEGETGHFAWGKASHVVAFGKHIEEQPEKLQKILQIIERLATDDEFASAVRMGEEGVTYKKLSEEEGGGAVFLEPYTDNNQRNKALFAKNLHTLSFYALFPTSYEFYINESIPQRERELYEGIMKPEYSKTDYFLKPDTLPSAGIYLKTLQDKQMSIIAEIIRGDKTVEQYSEFEEYWANNGGKVLEEEAQQLKKDLQNIYKQIGVSE